MLGLRPYQADAADFLYANDRAMVLAPVGAGKTALTLTAMRDALRDGVVKRWYPQARTIDEPGVIDAWNRGEVELLLIHPKSAGHGLNLQHGGCRMVFMSLPWSLEEYEQTVGRLHRSGQRHDVWVYVLQTGKTIDEKIWAALHDKRAMSDVAMWELK